MAQLVKDPPAIWETWVHSLDREDPLEMGKATHSSILAWGTGVSKSRTRLSDFHFTFTERGKNMGAGSERVNETELNCAKETVFLHSNNNKDGDHSYNTTYTGMAHDSFQSSLK